LVPCSFMVVAPQVFGTAIVVRRIWASWRAGTKIRNGSANLHHPSNHGTSLAHQMRNEITFAKRRRRRVTSVNGIRPCSNPASKAVGAPWAQVVDRGGKKAPQRAGDCARQQACPHRGDSPQGALFRVRQDRCNGAPTSLILAPSRRGLATPARAARPARRLALTPLARSAFTMKGLCDVAMMTECWRKALIDVSKLLG
jgi:hypothetical protein